MDTLSAGSNYTRSWRPTPTRSNTATNKYFKLSITWGRGREFLGKIASKLSTIISRKWSRCFCLKYRNISWRPFSNKVISSTHSTLKMGNIVVKEKDGAIICWKKLISGLRQNKPGNIFQRGSLRSSRNVANLTQCLDSSTIWSAHYPNKPAKSNQFSMTYTSTWARDRSAKDSAMWIAIVSRRE